MTIEQLAAQRDRYQGQRVRTTGVLRVFSAGTPDEHFVVEQAGQYRVGLRGIAADRLRPLLGTPVEVEGVLQFAESFGVYLQVERLRPAP